MTLKKATSITLCIFMLLFTSQSTPLLAFDDTFTIPVEGSNDQTINTPTPPPAVSHSTFTTPKNSLSLTIEPESITFDDISATNPLLRDIHLTTAFETVPGYQLFAVSDHPLKHDTDSIPYTSCDNGKCSDKTAAIWDSSLTYGVGYRCDGGIATQCDSTFTDQNMYKTIQSVSENSLSPIVSSYTAGDGILRFKVNIPRTQQKGLYTNTLQVIAIPNY